MGINRGWAGGVVIALFCLSACFEEPEVPEGLQCSPDDNCPPGQACFDGLCAFGPGRVGADAAANSDASATASVRFGAGEETPLLNSDREDAVGFSFTNDGYVQQVPQP